MNFICVKSKNLLKFSKFSKIEIFQKFIYLPINILSPITSNHFLYFCVDNIINKNNDNDKLNLKKLTNTDLSIDVAKFSKFYTNNFRNI